MNTMSPVAGYIASRIEATGQGQKDIAEKVGFETPNMITMVKQGKTRLPLDKIGAMAQALEADPVILFSMCMEECHPNTWKAIAPFLESVMTTDEHRMLSAIRAFIGGPFLAAMSDDAKGHFDSFLLSLRTPATIQYGGSAVITRQHANIRSQQRGIQPIVIDLLLKFGSSEQAGTGASKVFFDKRARRRLKSYAGPLAAVIDE